MACGICVCLFFVQVFVLLCVVLVLLDGILIVDGLVREVEGPVAVSKRPWRDEGGSGGGGGEGVCVASVTDGGVGCATAVCGFIDFGVETPVSRLTFEAQPAQKVCLYGSTGERYCRCPATTVYLSCRDFQTCRIRVYL